MTIEEVLIKANEVPWVKYIALGKLNKDHEEDYIGYSKIQNGNGIVIGTANEKYGQYMYLKNISNISPLSVRILTIFKEHGLDLTEVRKRIAQEGIYSVIKYYRIFGHDGFFDDMFLNTEFFYMLEYPQIYFSSPETPKEFKSTIYSEKISFSIDDIAKIKNNTLVGVNSDNCLVVKTNYIPFVTGSKRQLLTINESSLKAFQDTKN
jgi:hypothetical protein